MDVNQKYGSILNFSDQYNMADLKKKKSFIETFHKLPRHVVLQVRNTMDSPGQKAPPKLGVGLLHMRYLLDCPRPQVLEQADHSLHFDQPPSIGNTGNTDK